MDMMKAKKLGRLISGVLAGVLVGASLLAVIPAQRAEAEVVLTVVGTYYLQPRGAEPDELVPAKRYWLELVDGASGEHLGSGTEYEYGWGYTSGLQDQEGEFTIVTDEYPASDTVRLRIYTCAYYSGGGGQTIACLYQNGQSYEHAHIYATDQIAVDGATLDLGNL